MFIFRENEREREFGGGGQRKGEREFQEDSLQSETPSFISGMGDHNMRQNQELVT